MKAHHLDVGTAREIEQFLQDSLGRLQATVHALVTGRRGDDLGREADVTTQATATLHDEILAAIVNRRAREAAQIGEALDRLARGHYGMCTSCAEFIGLPRLRALPFAQRCSACQARFEMKARRGAEPVATA